MTATAPAPLRTFSFGELQSGAWGTMLAGEAAFLAVGAGSEASTISPFTVDGTGPDEPWSVAGEGITLVLTGDGDPVPADASDGFVQLCLVTGRAKIGGGEREFDCAGIRGARDSQGLPQFESLREIAALFERDEGVAALSLRPRKASGHSGDATFATVIDVEGPVSVAESRVSTTYTAGGVPVRMGLELWIGEEESEQYPRRVAGEASGPPVSASVDGLQVLAAPLRCHSRGREGAGVYLLAQRG